MYPYLPSLRVLFSAALWTQAALQLRIARRASFSAAVFGACRSCCPATAAAEARAGGLLDAKGWIDDACCVM